MSKGLFGKAMQRYKKRKFVVYVPVLYFFNKFIIVVFSVYRLVYNMLKRSLFSRVTNPYTHSAAEFVQTNRWHKQQSVTRSTDVVRTAWDAISLCHQFQSPKLFRVTNPDTHSAAEFVQTNRWHKQQSVTRSTDEVRTAWDAISLCRQNISAASQDTHTALEYAALFKVTLHRKWHKNH